MTRMPARCILFFFFKATFFSFFLPSVRQAIFELSQGEQDLIEDLKLAKKVHMLVTSLHTA